MSKYQTDREIFYGICKFFSSKAWWRPIIEFIYSNSQSFLNSLEYSTEEEHNIYIKFMNMITDLVDNYMCSKLHISADTFENFMSQFLTKPNEKATVIFDTLRRATDYNEFCKQMHLCNIRIENSITRALFKLSEDESITSTDDLAVLVAKQIEQDQNIEIEDLVHQGCVQIKKMMGISVLNSSPKRSNLKSSSSQASKSFTTPTKLIVSKIENKKVELDQKIHQEEQIEANRASENENNKNHKHTNSKSDKANSQDENEENISNSSISKDRNFKIKKDKKRKNDKKAVSEFNNKKDKAIKNALISETDDEKESDKEDKSDEIIIRKYKDDDKSDLSEVSDEGSDSDLIPILKGRNLPNKRSFKKRTARPPLKQINRLNMNKPILSKNINLKNSQKKTNISIVFDSP